LNVEVDLRFSPPGVLALVAPKLRFMFLVVITVGLKSLFCLPCKHKQKLNWNNKIKNYAKCITSKKKKTGCNETSFITF
jgi:hypothetical protein